MAKTAAVLLAAGQGKRMKSPISKQYLLLNGKPVLAYALKALEESFIDEIVLVVEEGREAYCRKEIVEKYGAHKVTKIVSGGKERYHSVQCGLKSIEGAERIYIHDGARPFLSQDLLKRLEEASAVHKACITGMPVKDTIKIAGGDGFVESTPDRSRVWQIQTPQVFSAPLIQTAYEKLMEHPDVQVTDDAMVAELMLGEKAYLVEGSYENLKITTQEDLAYGELICRKYWA